MALVLETSDRRRRQRFGEDAPNPPSSRKSQSSSPQRLPLSPNPFGAAFDYSLGRDGSASSRVESPTLLRMMEQAKEMRKRLTVTMDATAPPSPSTPPSHDASEARAETPSFQRMLDQAKELRKRMVITPNSSRALLDVPTPSDQEPAQEEAGVAIEVPAIERSAPALAEDLHEGAPTGAGAEPAVPVQLAGPPELKPEVSSWARTVLPPWLKGQTPLLALFVSNVVVEARTT